MKKLLVALVATSMMASAFADDHHMNMVRFDGLEQDDRTGRSFDLSFDSADSDKEAKSTNIALNYHRSFGQWQVGIAYRSYSQELQTGGENEGSSIGLSGHYNFESDLTNTCYVGLHLMNHSGSEGSYDFGGAQDLMSDDKAQTVALEYGHRFSLGEIMGLHVAYSPAVMYTMTSYEWDNEANDDVKGATHTSLTWNWVAFDVFF